MSFLRHKEIYRPILRAEGGLAAAPINHRFDEFPTSYSLTSCSPALLVSASLALGSMIDLSPAGNDLPANSNLSLVSVFHGRGALQPELPSMTISTDLVLHDKAHDLHLAFRGKGHTAGDVVVYCPQKKVVATGDLLHGFAPFILDGYPMKWPQTLRAFSAFEFNHVIGGHGGVQDSKLRLYQMAAYIEDLSEEVTKLKRQGRAVADVKKLIDPGKLKSLSRDGYGEFLMDSLTKYRLIKPGTPRATILSEAVAGNIDHIYENIDKE